LLSKRKAKSSVDTELWTKKCKGSKLESIVDDVNKGDNSTSNSIPLPLERKLKAKGKKKGGKTLTRSYLVRRKVNPSRQRT
jgi:hypothetical protein